MNSKFWYFICQVLSQKWSKNDLNLKTINLVKDWNQEMLQMKLIIQFHVDDQTIDLLGILD